MKIIVGLLSVLGCLVLFGAQATAGTPKKQTHEECVKACNVKFTQPYLACGQVVECQRFVESEAAICIRHCGE